MHNILIFCKLQAQNLDPMKADKTIRERPYKGCEQGNEISFSVLMPTFNQCAFIRRAISSLLQQTYPYWELIIINDGCTDATKDFISDYLSDPRIKYIENDTNRGPYSDLSALQQEFAQCWDVNTHRYEIRCRAFTIFTHSISRTSSCSFKYS